MKYNYTKPTNADALDLWYVHPDHRPGQPMNNFVIANDPTSNCKIEATIELTGV
jgi:hypothetical protein